MTYMLKSWRLASLAYLTRPKQINDRELKMKTDEHERNVKRWKANNHVTCVMNCLTVCHVNSRRRWWLRRYRAATSTLCRRWQVLPEDNWRRWARPTASRCLPSHLLQVNSSTWPSVSSHLRIVVIVSIYGARTAPWTQVYSTSQYNQTLCFATLYQLTSSASVASQCKMMSGCAGLYRNVSFYEHQSRLTGSKRAAAFALNMTPCI